jgi:hypothetical protein
MTKFSLFFISSLFLPSHDYVRFMQRGFGCPYFSVAAITAATDADDPFCLFIFFRFHIFFIFFLLCVNGGMKNTFDGHHHHLLQSMEIIFILRIFPQ